MTRQQVQDRLPDGMTFEKLVQELKSEKEQFDDAGLQFNVDIDGATEAELPEPDGTKPGGKSDVPPKGKPQLPRSRGRRVISPQTMALLASSENGHH